MNYQEWLQNVPDAIQGDVLWRVEAYRLGLFLADLAWIDVAKITRTRYALSLADQLLRACGSVSANIAEGYSRSSIKDQARFYEYALGSARESRDWYYKARNLLGPEVSHHRIELITHVIRLLLRTVSTHHNKIRESEIEYLTDSFSHLLAEIPLPDDH